MIIPQQKLSAVKIHSLVCVMFFLLIMTELSVSVRAGNGQPPPPPPPPLEDTDKDGYINIYESEAGSDPLDSLSIPVDTELVLRVGYNIIGYPVTETGGITAFKLLELLGDETQIESLYLYDEIVGSYRVIAFESGIPHGEDGVIGYQQGVVVYAKAGMTLPFNKDERPQQSFINCRSKNFRTGLNVITLPCAPPGLTSFQFLSALEREGVISSVQRFNPLSGEFETAGYRTGKIVGMDFPIRGGEGYFLFMPSDVSDWDISLIQNY
jgi:hypothetical protein